MFRHQTTICREGLYFLAIIALVFGGAIIKEVNLLLILAGMLLGPFLLNWRAVKANLRGLKVERNLPLQDLRRRRALGRSEPDEHAEEARQLGGRRRGANSAGSRQRPQQSPPPADAAAQRAVPLRARRPDRARASTAAGWSSAAATAWGRCGPPRDSPSACSPARSRSASRKHSSCCRDWAG